MYYENGRKRYELINIDGVELGVATLNQFIKSKSTVDTIVRMTDVCISAMGISVPVKTDVLIVKKPINYLISFDDLMTMNHKIVPRTQEIWKTFNISKPKNSRRLHLEEGF